MGNLVTNKDDLVFLQLEEITDILVMLRPDYQRNNIPNAIEIVADIPQYQSYDTFGQGQSKHICFLQRNSNQQADNSTTGIDTEDPFKWQTWSMTTKPGYIVVRPEVFQCKSWEIKARFVGDIRPGEVVTDAEEVNYMSDFVLVFSISK
jgi:hypothetical protein